MGPFQICGCPFCDPRVFELARIFLYTQKISKYVCIQLHTHDLVIFHLPGEGCSILSGVASPAPPSPPRPPCRLPIAVGIARPPPVKSRSQWARLDLNGKIEGQIKCQSRCQIECQNICQVLCQNMCQIEC